MRFLLFISLSLILTTGVLLAQNKSNGDTLALPEHSPKGILVIQSVPDSVQIWIPGMGIAESVVTPWMVKDIQQGSYKAVVSHGDQVFNRYFDITDNHITYAMVTDIKILVAPCSSLGKEAARVVRSSPDWTPAYKNGKPVRVVMYFPINFILQ